MHTTNTINTTTNYKIDSELAVEVTLLTQGFRVKHPTVYSLEPMTVTKKDHSRGKEIFMCTSWIPWSHSQTNMRSHYKETQATKTYHTQPGQSGQYPQRPLWTPVCHPSKRYHHPLWQLNIHHHHHHQQRPTLSTINQWTRNNYQGNNNTSPPGTDDQGAKQEKEL